jgi:hypothetical protein
LGRRRLLIVFGWHSAADSALSRIHLALITRLTILTVSLATLHSAGILIACSTLKLTATHAAALSSIVVPSS